MIIGLETAVLNYLLVTLLAGIYVGIILIVNHAGMATSIDYANLPLMERVGCTTRNLGEGWFSDFIWGGINNHVEHHLYPSLPASKLGKARKIVKKYYQTHGLPYHESNFFTALNEALNYFKEISPLDRVMEPLN
ncbi:fatty acid desaturase family protein [Endozoicomonas sp.]|uniref:fatty acid desaturase family protein n=1 Tax=Endozoicomonas sp. TaxID=1892382 RepID=UPI003AF61867